MSDGNKLVGYWTVYPTELVGNLTLVSDGERLAGCWFDHDRYAPVELAVELRRDQLPLFDKTRSWLDEYFLGERPGPSALPLAPAATEFQAWVREILLGIPYGTTTTYGAIAKRLAAETGRRQSSRAVGGAVGRNPICIIVPCHRVIGANGNLTGFGGGMARKVALLTHEGAMRDSFVIPTTGTAL